MQYWASIHIHIVQRMYSITIFFISCVRYYCTGRNNAKSTFNRKKLNYKQYLQIIANIY